MEDFVFDDEYDEFLDEDFLCEEEEDDDEEDNLKNNNSENESDTDSDDNSDSDSSLDDDRIEDLETEEPDSKNKIKNKDKYIGCPYLTKFEKVRVLGTRAEQIKAGSKIFVQTNKSDPLEIALEELYAGKMPLLIRRYLNVPNDKNNYVDISVNSLIIL